MFRPYMAIIRF